MEQNGYQNVEQNENQSEQQNVERYIPASYNERHYYYQIPMPPKQESIGLAVASMVLGIISLVFSCIVSLSAICAVIALILGILSLCCQKGGKGMAIAGIVCSAIAIVLVICYVVIWNGFWAAWSEFWHSIF